MKYTIVALMVVSSVVAHAQSKNEDKQYQINPDSLAEMQPKKRPNLPGPLFILDDKQVTSEIVYGLDPNKIESINILKDSASTAPYGDKGKFGVIIIASKAKRKE